MTEAVEPSPGPWRIGTTYIAGDDVRAIVGPDDEVICVEPVSVQSYESCTIVTPEGTEANLKLLAAVPGLLDYVRECATDDLDRVSPGMQDKARKILATITGVQP